jgi:hypothetical protein
MGVFLGSLRQSDTPIGSRKTAESEFGVTQCSKISLLILQTSGGAKRFLRENPEQNDRLLCDFASQNFPTK